jgi:SAM-dependent methyltransferase
MAVEMNEIRKLAESFAAEGDPSGWFEQVYKHSGGDINQIYWADQEPNPSLVAWLENNEASGKRANVVGCGTGDDVAFLAAQGFQVIGFDVSETAIEMCKTRFPEIIECFQVADLFKLPASWPGQFDLVFECNTIQAVSGEWRVKALNGIADLVAPGGIVLVSCRSRNSGEKEDDFPLPLDLDEISGFERAGMRRLSLDSYDDDQQPPVPHFFACYQRV